MGKQFVKKVLSKDDLDLITAKIGEMERDTRGEIRVSVRERRQLGEKKLSLPDLAVREFYRLGMQKTEDRTGILIFLLFSEHKFHIVADEGINSKVEDGTWQQIANHMSDRFKHGEFRDGICEAVAAVGGVLKTHVPQKPGDTNELSNQVEIS